MLRVTSDQLSRREDERTIQPVRGNRAGERVARARRAGGEAVVVGVRDQDSHDRGTGYRTRVAKEDCARALRLRLRCGVAQ